MGNVFPPARAQVSRSPFMRRASPPQRPQRQHAISARRGHRARFMKTGRPLVALRFASPPSLRPRSATRLVSAMPRGPDHSPPIVVRLRPLPCGLPSADLRQCNAATAFTAGNGPVLAIRVQADPALLASLTAFVAGSPLRSRLCRLLAPWADARFARSLLDTPVPWFSHFIRRSR